jgi:hypothetical protein
VLDFALRGRCGGAGLRKVVEPSGEVAAARFAGREPCVAFGAERITGERSHVDDEVFVPLPRRVDDHAFGPRAAEQARPLDPHVEIGAHEHREGPSGRIAGIAVGRWSRNREPRRREHPALRPHVRLSATYMSERHLARRAMERDGSGISAGRALEVVDEIDERKHEMMEQRGNGAIAAILIGGAGRRFEQVGNAMLELEGGLVAGLREQHDPQAIAADVSGQNFAGRPGRNRPSSVLRTNGVIGIRLVTTSSIGGPSGTGGVRQRRCSWIGLHRHGFGGTGLAASLVTGITAGSSARCRRK